MKNLVNQLPEETKESIVIEQGEAMDHASEEIGITINKNNIDGKNWPVWLDQPYQYTKIPEKEKLAYASRMQRGTMGDNSSHNASLFHCEWTKLHDAALMYGMQAFGIC